MSVQENTINKAVDKFSKGFVDLYNGSRALFKGLGLTVWGG